MAPYTYNYSVGHTKYVTYSCRTVPTFVYVYYSIKNKNLTNIM